ncbi:hypothetical protein [Streptomyces sp. NBC_00328]|uniref:hypothetical protein n=1 Tax=Streptomyces sp. NBC_00328 TaxID=2903646 RepID=UPI002E2A1D95|nr:hypothetical protein [Streptomyces sp. NBC_00328]
MAALALRASGRAGTGSASVPRAGGAAPVHAPRAALRAGPARPRAACADRLSPARARRADRRARRAGQGYAVARPEDYL